MDNGIATVAGPSHRSPSQLSSPIPLSKRTSSRNALSQTYARGSVSPPSTPPPDRRLPRDKGKRPAREPTVTRRDQLKREGSAEGYNLRHSHGLSWSSTTRDSVVDNLLLALDGLSGQSLPGMDDVRDDEFEQEREKYRLPQMPQLPQYPASRPSSRLRGHTYSSSLSSGYDVYGTGESPSSKFSTSTKGRRSNSSSTFAVPNTISERAPPARRMNGSTRTSEDTLGHIGTQMKSAGSDLDGLNGRSSSAAETSRPWAGGRRSMSLDNIYGGQPSAGSMLGRGRPIPAQRSVYEPNEDAAPEPGVPAGPRKAQNPTATGPVYVNQAPGKASTIRKTHTQSDLRTASRPSPPIPQHIQEQASDFVRANSMRGGMPQMGLDKALPPMPGVQAARNKNAPSPSRERPGFFKRFFGPGSRSASGLSNGSDPHDVGYPDKAAPPMRKETQLSNDTTPQPSTVSRQTSKENSVPTSHPPQTLSKKPSAFFRRRKKSTSDMPPPPPMPVNISKNSNSATQSTTTLSLNSLRQVMDPYLHDDGTPKAAMPDDKDEDVLRPTTNESATGDSDSLEMFHSGYTPPPDASLGKRDPLSRDASAKVRAKQNQGEESPKMKIKVKKRQPEIVEPQQNGETFLYDESRETSSATIGDHFQPPPELNRVSPMSELPPEIEDEERPVSRASTGDRIIASKAVSPIEPVRSFSADDYSSTVAGDDSWIISHPPKSASFVHPALRQERLILKPTEAEERHEDGIDGSTALAHSRQTSQAASMMSRLASPGFSPGHGSSEMASVYHSATSLPLPNVQIEGNDVPDLPSESPNVSVPSALVDEDAEYTERARKIYEGDEEDVMKSEAASWLGEQNTLSTRTLNAYMRLFDFAGMNILAALRALCGKLLLKGETQQFDRIITVLSARWCECNSKHGFKAQDVVHTIFYSLVLLNTDLHLADIGEKMSRTAYVKNTLPTIRRVVLDAAPNAFEDTAKPSPQTSRPSLPWVENVSVPTSPTLAPADTPSERTSFEKERPAAYKRLSLRPGMLRVDSDGASLESTQANALNGLVKNPWNGPLRGWLFEIETILKAFFGSIRNDPLPLLTAPEPMISDRNLNVASYGGLKRTGSVLSKAPSENLSYRSKPGLRTMTMGWQSRLNRSRPKLYPSSTLGSSRTSFDDSNSVWSPAQSSIMSKNSFSKTLTSASMNSLGYHFSPTTADYKHSIGFANALSQAIIREECVGQSNGETESISAPAGLLEDEALALEGAPWAKEGLVKHKHHLESPDRKAKERSWNDCFAVISKGKLTLFAFNTSSKSHSMGRKNHGRQNGGRAASIAGATVGGGDWMENAEQLDVFTLRQTIASTLPPPGYSKARPHVWALSLPSGAVHLFQVGTPEIAQEFRSTANYWSARLSKEPLSGGVSNIEYGWSDQIINLALLERTESVSGPPASIQNTRGHMHSASNANMSRPSFQSSLRSSFDTGFGVNARNKLPGDKAQIAEWQPPNQSMMASQLLEVDQLRALTTYVDGVEAELAMHNELKHAIELAYSPRHANHNKAMANWQRKSDHLLREIVKFRTYIDSLSAAQRAKEKFYARKTEFEAAKEDSTPRPSQTVD